MRTSRNPLASPRSTSTGFTLVEVLVTLLIVGGIMVSVTSILQAARISRDAIHNLQETQLAGPAILDWVERDLRGLFVFNQGEGRLLRVKHRIQAGMDADSIDFVTTTDSVLGYEVRDRLVRADLSEVGYRLRPRPDDDDFLELYRREALGIDEAPFEGGEWVFLSDRVRQFDVQVYTEDGPDAEPEESWEDPPEDEVGLPKRLEITLVLELAPRLVREQTRFASLDKRLVTYKRVIRVPQGLFDALAVDPVPAIPALKPPSEGQDPTQQAAQGTPAAK